MAAEVETLAHIESAAAASREDDTPESQCSVVHVRIQNLRRHGPRNVTADDDAEAVVVYEESIAVETGTPLSTLWEKLHALGYDKPVSLTRGDKKWHLNSVKTVLVDYELIEVVQDGPSMPGKNIHIDERFIAYANRHYGRPVSLNLAESGQDQINGQVDKLNDSGGLEITFHRTLRMPDDDKIHQLPPSLGPFPLYSVAEYPNSLPDKILKDGGVFLPMWQREALWIGLCCPSITTYALRIFVGRVNAISGAPITQDKELSTETDDLQDYVVVPGQAWVDGICVAPGIVRQFVAMPLGSGYTVEGQKTGEEKHGGLQIEIIPSFESHLRTWIRDDLPLPSVLSERLRLDEHKTPRELGFGVENRVRLYPAVATHDIPYTVSHLIEDVRAIGALTLEAMYSRGWTVSTSFTGSYEGDSYEGDSYEGDSYEGNSFEGRSYERPWPTYIHPRIITFDQGGTSSFTDPSQIAVPPQQPKPEKVRPPELVTRNLKAMGLAAGGKLVQDIYRDRNPAKLWNTEAAKIVNVHILDPTSCEAVTHIVPPPPPTDARTYIKDGGSFFVVDEQPENRLEGGSFEEIKSVSAMDQAKGIGAEPSLDPSQQTQCKCGIRLCDCVVRPCNHQFCNVCIREMDPTSLADPVASAESPSSNKWFCPTCKAAVAYVAGFSAPMNLPGEETIKERVPVRVLEIKDGRVAFKSIERSRV